MDEGWRPASRRSTGNGAPGVDSRTLDDGGAIFGEPRQDVIETCSARAERRTVTKTVGDVDSAASSRKGQVIVRRRTAPPRVEAHEGHPPRPSGREAKVTVRRVKPIRLDSPGFPSSPSPRAVGVVSAAPAEGSGGREGSSRPSAAGFGLPGRCRAVSFFGLFRSAPRAGSARGPPPSLLSGSSSHDRVSRRPLHLTVRGGVDVSGPGFRSAHDRRPAPLYVPPLGSMLSRPGFSVPATERTR